MNRVLRELSVIFGREPKQPLRGEPATSRPPIDPPQQVHDIQPAQQRTLPMRKRAAVRQKLEQIRGEKEGKAGR